MSLCTSCCPQCLVLSMLSGFLLPAPTSASVAVDNCNSRFAKHNDPFLGRVVHTRAEIHGEVEKVLTSKYRSDTTERLRILADEMGATYLALPKTAHGYLGVAASRYLIHRHFHRSRAWLVDGIAPDGRPWNASSPTALLNYSTPAVHELFEQRLRGRGLDLQEVALLTAMIENRVHQDAVSRLHKAWDALEMPVAVSMKDMELVLDAWMMSYILQDVRVLNKENVSKLLPTVDRTVKKWSDIQSHMHGVLRRVVPRGESQFSFDDAEHAVVEISETYGKFSEADCKEIKLELMEIEGPRPGRVDVRDFFWEAVNHGKYHFAESVYYMNRTGILDNTDPHQPSIVIPNYLDAPSQNVFTSETFSLVCASECEQLLHEIERRIQAPYSTPERLASVVTSLSSDTQRERPSGLPPALLLRLSQIVQPNSQGVDGAVPLHGRLFAQWLHHAFPRECPYPHVSSAGIELLPPDEFQKKYGVFEVSAKDKLRYANATRPLQVSSPQLPDELPWDTTEELLAPRIEVRSLFLDVFVNFMKIAAAIALFLTLLANMTFVREVCNASSKSERSKLMRAGPRNSAVVSQKLC